MESWVYTATQCCTIRYCYNNIVALPPLESYWEFHNVGFVLHDVIMMSSKLSCFSREATTIHEHTQKAQMIMKKFQMLKSQTPKTAINR